MDIFTDPASHNVPTELGDSEWNFSEHVLPDAEVRACLIWECGRESFDLFAAGLAEDLESKIQPFRWDSNTGKRIKNSLRSRRRAVEELKELAFDLDAHRARLYKCTQAFNSFYSDVTQYARPWSRPWREFPKTERQKAVQRLNDPGIFPPFRAATLHELEALWTTNGKEIINLKEGITKPKYDDTLEMLGYEPSQAVEMPGDEQDPKVQELTGAFAINFSLYSDREIAAGFLTWLKEVRPCPEPIRVGKKINDDRAALEGLGIMRAFHHHPFSHPLFPSQLKRLGRRACDKRRELAYRRYHEVLPFIPAESVPIHWYRAKRATKSK